MRFGIQMFPTDYAISPVELGKAVEDLGFESLFFPEHTHIPTSRKSPWPGGPELPREYSHTLDPFVALGAVAGVTTTLKLGTGICLVVERDPIITAKEVASLDHLSGGRVLFGIGGGWNLEEMENHGTKPSLRWKILRERVLAMKEIWTKDEAEFHGEYVDFDPIWSWPKPVQQPHPPILVGGDGPRTLDRVIEYGDEWMPIGARTTGLAEKIQRLEQMAQEAGKQRPLVSIFGASSKPEAMEAMAEAGVDRLVFGVAPGSAESVIPVLQRYADAIRIYV